MKCFAFLGIQGSGKGTQAEKLSYYLHYQHINIGDLFRYHVSHETELGLEVRKIIQRGELVPDHLVFSLINHSIAEKTQGIVFDGFPRTIPQAEFLVAHYDLLQVFYLILTESEAKDRISFRRVCSSCGTNYNLHSSPPQKPDICDTCGSELIIRPDDQPAAIEKRFQEFYQQTQPLVEFFRAKGVLVEVLANQSIPQIYQTLLSSIKK